MLSAADLLTTGAFDGALRPLPEAKLRVDARVHGSLRAAATTGLVTSPRVQLAFYDRAEGGSGPYVRSVTTPVIPLTDLATSAPRRRDARLAPPRGPRVRRDDRR